MESEQSSADSVSAAIDAMDNKLFGPEEPEQQEADPPESVEASDQETEDADAEQVDAEEGELEEPNGPNEPNDPKQLRALMTRKTQEAAIQTDLANDRIQYAEAREQFSAAVMQEFVELQTMQQQLKQYEGWDLSTLDVPMAMKLRDQRDDLRREIQKREQIISAKAKQMEAMQQAHMSKQWELAVNGFKAKMPNITPQQDNLMLQRANELGFNPKELRGRFADPRILELIHDSAMLRQIKSGKTQALNTARQAPPVVKPGSVDPQMSSKMRELNWAKQMKNANSTKERVSLAEAKMARFFG